MGPRQTFASRRIVVNGFTLNVVVAGEGPDVMLHGKDETSRPGRLAAAMTNS
jgi:hypothetical protein